MKPKLLGSTVCLILRRHNFKRRIDRNAPTVTTHYVCARCGATKQINHRKPKVTS